LCKKRKQIKIKKKKIIKKKKKNKNLITKYFRKLFKAYQIQTNKIFKKEFLAIKLIEDSVNEQYYI
jgi:hypothetical protein